MTVSTTASKASRVGPSAFGLGVFSLRSFSAREVVGPIEGQIFDGDEYESDYCMALGANSALEPEPRSAFSITVAGRIVRCWNMKSGTTTARTGRNSGWPSKRTSSPASR